MIDIIIIGAGPAGLATAVAAGKRKLDCLMIDKGSLVHSIVNFPTDMVFFSTSELLEIGGLPFTSSQIKPTRRETVRYYQQVARYFNIKMNAYRKFTEIKEVPDGYRVTLKNLLNGANETYSSRNVVFATGFYDYPKLLNVPGEDLPQVSHYYREPFPFHDQEVVMIGAGNSAVEAALDIFRNGGRVTMIHRGEEIKKGVKYWVLPDILNRISENNIKLITRAFVVEINRDSVVYDQDGNTGSVFAQHVLALTGYQPDRQVLDLSGAEYDPETLEPAADPETFESTRPGIYFAGSMLAGIFPNRIFIENSRTHGDAIVQHIISK